MFQGHGPGISSWILRSYGYYTFDKLKDSKVIPASQPIRANFGAWSAHDVVKTRKLRTDTPPLRSLQTDLDPPLPCNYLPKYFEGGRRPAPVLNPNDNLLKKKSFGTLRKNHCFNKSHILVCDLVKEYLL